MMALNWATKQCDYPIDRGRRCHSAAGGGRTWTWTMTHRPDSAVCLVNDRDPFACDMSSNSLDCDSHALLPGEDDGEVKSYRQLFSGFLQVALTNHFKTFIIVCDVFCIIIFTLFFTTLNSLTCEKPDDGDLLEWCRPYQPVDRVIVDLNFGLLVHCDCPRSCVAYAEVMMTKQGFNYNFVIGDEELVYVGHGYQCRSDALRLQMLVTRYTWDPNQPVYRVPGEVVVRYGEIIYEGLSCGKILPNFTVTVNCSVYGEFCGADNIRDLIPWRHPEPLAMVQQRYPWPEPRHRPGHPFLAFDTSRVYERHHRLAVCNHTRSRQQQGGGDPFFQ